MSVGRQNSDISDAKQTKNLKELDSLRDPWDNIHHTKIIYSSPRRRKDREWVENILEDKIAKNFPNLGKNNPFMEAQYHEGLTQRGIH